jgi:crossover junction endodeoxyribonuclease RusA
VIDLVLPYPLSANRYWATRVVKPKGGGRALAMTYVTPEAKDYRDAVARAHAGRPMLRGRVAVFVWLYPHRPQDWQKRQRQLGAAWDDSVQCIDLDNANKVLLDALKGVAIEDDRWVRRIVAERMEPDEHGARVAVRIKPLPAEVRQLELVA